MSFTSKQLGSNRIYNNNNGNCPPNIINISNLIDKCVKQVGVDDYTLKVETTATVGTITVEDKSTSDEIGKVTSAIGTLDGNLKSEIGKVTTAIGHLETGLGLNTDDSITGQIEQLIGINKVTTDEGEIITNTDLILKLIKQKEVTGDTFPAGTIYELQETLNKSRHEAHIGKIGESVSAIGTLDTNSANRHSDHLNKIGESVTAINTLDTNSKSRHTEQINKITAQINEITGVASNATSIAQEKESNDSARHKTLVSNLHPCANTSNLIGYGDLDLY